MPKGKEARQHALAEHSSLIYQDGVLYKVVNPNSTVKGLPRVQVVIPESMRHSMLHLAHDALIGGGHLGWNKTYAKLNERCWWPGMYVDVKHWVSSCMTCGSMHRSTRPPPGELQPIVANSVFELVGIDIVGPFPRTVRGNKFLLVMTDHYSKFAISVPLANITSIDVANALMDHLVYVGFDIPKRILSDQGSNFNSALIREFYELLEIHKNTTSAYHPQCDGHTERFNGTLCGIISRIVEVNPIEWDIATKPATLDYNQSQHATTLVTPSYVVFGREPRGLMDLMLGTPNEEKAPSVQQYVKELEQRIIDTNIIVRNNLELARERQKAAYDSARPPFTPQFKEGSAIWIKNFCKPKPGTSSKFTIKWFPGVVTGRTGNSTFVVKAEKLPKEQTVHVSRIRPLVIRTILPPVGIETPEQFFPAPEEIASPDDEVVEPVELVMDALPNPEAPIISKSTDIKLETAVPAQAGTNTPAPPPQGAAPMVSDPKPTHALPDADGEIPDDHIITEILWKGEIKGLPGYLVKWQNGEQSWIFEEDMNCPELLVEFTKKLAVKQDEKPHEQLLTLLESLGALLQLIKRSPRMSDTLIKRRVREFVATSNPFLKSRRVITELERQIKAVKNRADIISMLEY